MPNIPVAEPSSPKYTIKKFPFCNALTSPQHWYPAVYVFTINSFVIDAPRDEKILAKTPKVVLSLVSKFCQTAIKPPDPRANTFGLAYKSARLPDRIVPTPKLPILNSSTSNTPDSVNIFA